jgi:pheromone shutdown protein TraB
MEVNRFSMVGTSINSGPGPGSVCRSMFRKCRCAVWVELCVHRRAELMEEEDNWWTVERVMSGGD